MKKNLRFLILLSLCLFIFSEAGTAAGKPLRLTVLQSRKLAPYEYVYSQICEKLRFDRVDFEPTVYYLTDITDRLDYESLESSSELQKFAKGLINSRPDIIISIGTESTVFLAKNVKDIPVIFTMVYRTDLFERYIGGAPNTKGVFLTMQMEKPFALLKEIKPELKKIGVIYSPEMFQNSVSRLSDVAAKQGLALVGKSVTKSTELPDALKEIIESVDAILLLPDPLTMNSDFLKKVMLISIGKGILVFGESYEIVTKGALAGFAFNVEEVIKNTVQHIENLRKGNSVEALANLECSQYRLFLNSRISDSMKIKFSDKILKEAGRTGKIVE
jgi:putative tryptophan/tyrosine transport system substrate-binding protein